MPRDGTKNLIPLNQRTKEEQKEIRKKAGIKSGEVRREKSKRLTTFREVAQAIFSNPNTNEKFAKKFEDAGIPGDTNEHLANIIIRAMKDSEKGDNNARKFLKELIDGVEQQNINVNLGAQEDSDVLIYLPKTNRDKDLNSKKESPKGGD